MDGNQAALNLDLNLTSKMTTQNQPAKLGPWNRTCSCGATYLPLTPADDVCAECRNLPTPAESLRSYEAHSTGSEHLYPHWTKALTYTDGAKYLAETLSAYWLVDLIASHQPEIHQRHTPALAFFQVWEIKLNDDGGAAITAWSDTPRDPSSTLLASQVIEYTDWPAELEGYTLWVESGTLLLKAEH